ncbi:myocyte-specific enhancer factor 2A-like isoform X2 [Oryzias latipes]|uniref:MADS-box domain-containing protein n=1 Tax=Oryzias latipes TaxID=8090 RepID=H2MJC1_ORYLA|nr:myocyte-specific enhancer factor 2A-like isoform X2 [Oryzias latipes]
MGRKKIQITRIVDERNRQVTFMKRKFGLMKKAYELSVLCDCEIALIIFNGSNKLFQYASTDMDKVLLKYTEYNEPHESRTNSDIVEALNKKEHRGCESPDGEASYVLTPTTEEKYKKINEEFDNMMKSHKISAGQPPPPQHFLHASPGGAAYCPGGGGATSQALAAATAVLADSGILALPPHRNINPSHRPASAGHTVNGFVGSCGGSGLGKVAAPKSPPPPPPPPQGNSLVLSGRKADLRVVIPHSKAAMLNNQRLSSSQSGQPLTTPVVSINTPSLPHHSLVYSGVGYSGDYALSSAELCGFGSAAGPSLGSMAAWGQHQLSSLGSGSSSFSVGTNHNINIKAEPLSPPRDLLSQPGYVAHPLPHSSSSAQAEVGRSPADSVSSSCSSHEGGSEREEQPPRPDFHSLPEGRAEGGESPTSKRMRLDGWVT